MGIVLRTKNLDVSTGSLLIAVINREDSERYGLPKESVVNIAVKDTAFYVTLDVSDTLVQPGQIGLYSDIYARYGLRDGESASILIDPPNEVHKIIRKKVLGHALSEDEIDLLVRALISHSVKDVMLAYFLATFFNPGFDDDEALSMVKSIIRHGRQLTFSHTSTNVNRKDAVYVVDKHSIGGLASKGVTPILVSILACYKQLLIPNTSTRAITSAAGTSDVLETVMDVEIPEEEFIKQVETIGAGMIYGGGLKLTPATYEMIRLEHGMHIESFQKVAISIVANKKSMGLTHVLIDLPYGKSAKVHHPEDADKLKKFFEYLFAGVGIKVKVHRRLGLAPDGFGIGPNLEMRDILYVLEQDDRRPEHLQHQAVEMAGELLELTGLIPKGWGYQEAKRKLRSGQALDKFWEIAIAQGASKRISAGEIELAQYSHIIYGKDILALSAGASDAADHESAIVKEIDNSTAINIAKRLGSPLQPEAGIYLHKYIGDEIKATDKVVTFYTAQKERLSKVIEDTELYKDLFVLG